MKRLSVEILIGLVFMFCVLVIYFHFDVLMNRNKETRGKIFPVLLQLLLSLLSTLLMEINRLTPINEKLITQHPGL